MHIDSIQMKDFCNHAETKVVLGATPIAILLGPNEAGKTAVLDAVRWALTNKARGYTGAGNRALVRRGAKSCRVELVAKAGETTLEVARTPSGATLTQAKILQALGLRDEDALDAALDAGKFLSLSPRDRRALAFRLGGAVVDEKALRERGITDPEVIAAALSPRGFEAGEKVATEKKRAAGRALDLLTSTAPQDEQVGEHRLSQMNLAAIRERVAALRSEREEKVRSLAGLERDAAAATQAGPKRDRAVADLETARRALAAIEDRLAKAASERPDPAVLRREASTYEAAATEPVPPEPRPPVLAAVPSTAAEQRAVHDAEQRIERAKASPWTRVREIASRVEAHGAERAGIAEDVQDLRALADANVDDLGRLARALDLAKASLQASVAEASRVQKSNAAADASYQSAMAAHATACAERDARVAVARKARAEALARAETAEKVAAADRMTLDSARSDVQSAASRLAGIEAAAVSAPAADAVAGLRDAVEKMQRAADDLDIVARRVEDYRVGRERFDAEETKRGALTREAVRYEAMEKALRPDGVMAQLVAAPLARLREVLAKVSPDVRVTDDWDVLYRDHPVPEASTSARWRVAAYLAIALGAVSGLRFAILDEASVLVGRAHKALLSALLAAREHFDQVVLVLSRSEEDVAKVSPVAPSLVGTVGLWRVIDGRVERVEQPVPASTPVAAPAAA